VNILKTTIVSLILCTGVSADDKLQPEADLNYEEEMSIALCSSVEHRFDPQANACVYCAHGLHYAPHTSQCIGTPDVLGKCYGEHHYHAKTQECMYCAEGYLFHEDIRECLAADKEEKKK